MSKRIYSDDQLIRMRMEQYKMRQATLPRIQGKDLEPSDVGRNVTYTPLHGSKEFGTLSSYREDGAIFVRFKGPNGERCNAEQLTWG